MELFNVKLVFKIWIRLCIISLFLELAQATLIKRIKEKKEKGAQAAASTGQGLYASGTNSKGYGQTHPGNGNGGYGNQHHGGGGGYYDRYRDRDEDYPSHSNANGYRDGGSHEDYRGEPSHNPGRYVANGNSYGGGNGGGRGGGSGGGNYNRESGNRGYGGDSGNRGSGGHSNNPNGNGFNDDYYDGYSEDHSNGYGAVAPGVNGFDRDRGYNGNRRVSDDEDYYNDEQASNSNNEHIQGSHGPGCKNPHLQGHEHSGSGSNSHLPEIIITEKKPLKASDLDNGSSGSNSNRGIVDKIRNWRNGDKNQGKSNEDSANPIR